MFEKFKKLLTKENLGNIFVLCCGISFYLFFSNIQSVSGLWNKRSSVISPFLYAFALAFVLNKPVMHTQQRLFPKSKHGRSRAILVVYIIAAGIFYALLTSVLPQIGVSVANISESLPAFYDKASGWLNRMMNEYHFSQTLVIQLQSFLQNSFRNFAEFSLSILPSIVNFTISIGNGIVKVFMVFIISIYMLSGKEKLIFQAKKLVFALFSKETALKITRFANLTNTIFSDFIIGKMIDSIIIAVLCFIGMLVIYPSYSLLIAVIVGVTNMIPFFGPFIGAIPSAIILLISRPYSALIFLVFILALQQLDGNVIGPKILGDSLGLAPMWVLLGIVIGNGLFGLPGMIIGVPTFAVIYTLCSEKIRNTLREKNITVNSEEHTLDLSDSE